MNLFRLAISLAFLLCYGTPELRAEDQFPARTVKIIVPSSAGGVTDVLGRMVGQAMAKAWNIPVVIDNRPGADGMIGMDLVAKSERDGYTLLVSSDASFTAGPHLHADNPYHTLKDFTPIAFLGQISP